MQSERWKRIDQLLDAVLELDPDKRSSFLEQNCSSDEELRKEIEALLASDSKAHSFIESPAYLGAEKLLSTPLARLSSSQILSERYEILSSIGSGGMGEVYHAKDLRLGREVAIKVLPERMAKDLEASKRFEGEARALAALSHPNIVSVFDIATDQGSSYVVMELLQGETLRTRLRNGRLSWQYATEIGISIVEALSAAHSKGVIHRDLKPENIFLTSEGSIKILDFGLARFERMEEVTSTSSETGFIMGTVGYMSPEQIRALPVDARSDLFSFGCILYEVLSGKRPFTGDGAGATVASILNDEPPPISVKDSPRRLNEIIHRCLEKRPEDRFQSGQDLLVDLRKVHGRSAAQISSRRIKVFAILTLLIAAALIAALLLHRNSKTGSPDVNLHNNPSSNAISQGKPKTIAILPFRPIVAADRDEVLEVGMADTLITRLANTKTITVRPLSSVRSFMKPGQDSIKAGKALNVESVLEGSVQRSQDRIRVNARMIRVADGSTIWTSTFDERFTDIFLVQEAIAAKIAGALASQMGADERSGLQKRYTTNPQAYEYYLKGRYHSFAITEKSLRQGIEFYELAVTADPNYALAYADMADAYRRLGIVGFARPKEALMAAKLFAKKALELDDSLAEAYSVLGWVGFFYEWDWSGAENSLKRAIELSPNNSDVHLAYAHFLSCVARHEEAISEIRIAKELSPTTQILLTMESQFLLFAGRDEEAFRQAKKILDIDPNFWVALNQLGRIYSFRKQYKQAIVELTKANQIAPASSDPCMQLGYAFAITGDHKRAHEILVEMNRRSKERFVSFYNFAMINNGLGNTEKALGLLEKSVEDHEPQLTFIKIDRRWDNLRSDPRFVNILRKMNLAIE